MSRVIRFCFTMRRFFHRKAALTRPTAATAASNGAQPLGHRPRSSSSSSSTTNSPVHSPPGGRVRAPTLRSRSMSVLNGPALPANTSRRFTRSLSFCAENQGMANSTPSCFSRQLTKTEEDEVFRSYTRRVYGVVGALCAIIVAMAAYAYLYNYGNR